MMENIKIMKIRLRGIIECVKQYTDEPSIVNIIDNLTLSLDTNDFNVLSFACKELFGWYHKNRRNIFQNEYVYNKEVHEANFDYLVKLTIDIDKNSEEYRQSFVGLRTSVDIEKPISSIHTLFTLLERFHLVALQINERYDNRRTLQIDDEYDVQDLLHSLLYVFFDDIRPEEPTPSHAGTASRQDFLLKKEKIIIETKMTRKGLGNKELANQLIIDIERYKSHPDCQTLLCFVYDPNNIVRNPRGFENDLSKTTDGIDIIVLVRP